MASEENTTEKTPLMKSKTENETDENHDGEYTYEEAIAMTGYGKFHYLLLALCGWALSSDAIEMLSISFILPPATCDLNLSSSDKGLLNAVPFIGLMFGGYIWGSLADIHGRRLVLLYSLTVNALGGLAASFAQSFSLFLFLRFVSGIGVGGSMPVIFSYYTEFQPKQKRGSSISILATFWMSGNIVVAALAWIIIPLDIGVTSGSFLYNSWRIFLAVCTLPSLSSGFLFLLMPESPKFILNEKGSKQSIHILQKVFRSNNPDKYLHSGFPVRHIKDPDSELTLLHSDSEDDFITYGGCCSRFCYRLQIAWKKFYKATIELYSKPFTTTSVVMTTSFFTLSYGYYGLFLWFPELFNRIEKYGGSPCSLGTINETTSDNSSDVCTYDVSNKIYFSSFLTAASNLPGNILTVLVIDKIGRKIMLAGSMVISGLSVFFIALLHNSTQSLIMSCVFSAISVIGWNSLDVLGMELYPTKLRSTGMGIFLSFGRVGAILGNVTFGELVDVYCIVPMIMVAVLLSFGGLIAFKLPNTTNIDLLH